MDAVLGYVAADAAIVRASPEWFHSADAATGPIDPGLPGGCPAQLTRVSTDMQVAHELADWWIERLLRLTEWGVTGIPMRQFRA